MKRKLLIQIFFLLVYIYQKKKKKNLLVVLKLEMTSFLKIGVFYGIYDVISC
jgi:hypothetical protein